MYNNIVKIYVCTLFFLPLSTLFGLLVIRTPLPLELFGRTRISCTMYFLRDISSKGQNFYTEKKVTVFTGENSRDDRITRYNFRIIFE